MTKRMPLVGAWTVVVAAAMSSAADLTVKHDSDRLVITSVAGEHVAVFVFGDAAVGRPAIRDLAAPGGVVVTRPCPPRKGVDADDHATMHPGVWLCFSDLSGADPWRHKTAVRFAGFDAPPTVVDGAVRFTAKTEYLATATATPDAGVVCRERSTISISDRTVGAESVRILLWEAVLTPGDAGQLVLGDVEEMGLGVRLATPLSPAGGGRYLASHGGRDEKGIFGRAAGWVDASGTVDGRRVGAAVIDLDGNPREAFFHARDYGLVLANAFGRTAYGVKNALPLSLQRGESLRLRYAVVVHDDIPDARLVAAIDDVRRKFRDR